MYGLAVDNWSSLIASPHLIGDGRIVLIALNNLPTLPTARIYRLTAVLFPGLQTETILGVFEATGLTGLTLTGVTAAMGYPDVNLGTGVTVQVRVCKATIDELQAAVDTINSNFNSQLVHVTGNETITGIKTFTAPIIGTVSGMALDNAVVHIAGPETITGTKTFTSTMVGNVTGNAGTVTNGIYANGIYSDPAWLTSLSGSKIAGNILGFSGGLSANIAESQVTNLVSDLAATTAVLTTKANDSTVVHVTGNETIGGTKTFSSTIIGTVAGMALDNAVVHLAGTETITGIKTFSALINGDISGNSTTVTNGVVTTGTYNDPVWLVTLAGTKITGNIPGFAVGITANISEIQVTNLVSDLAAKAPLVSPTLIGLPTAPTANVGSNNTQLATTAFVQSAIGGVGGGAVASVFGRSGIVVATTGDYTVTQVTGAAPVASPAFSGVPTAPTPTGGTNTTQIATTAFVISALGGIGGGTVVSVFSRSGVITATTGDYTVSQVTGAAPLASPNFTGTVTIGTLAGLLKGTTGTVSVATAGTDYLAPSGSGAALTGITGTQITGNITGSAGGLTANIPESQVTNLTTDLGALNTSLAAKANDSSVVHVTGNETVGGIKTFSSLITGSISGNAGTVTNGVVTTGFYNDPTWITALAGSKITGNITGNASGLTANITETQVTNLTSDLNALITGLATKAPIFSPALTGTPTAPTASGGTNSTQLATTAFVQAAIAGGGATVTSVFGRSGVIVAATGDYSVAQVTGAAPLASPAHTGIPTFAGSTSGTTGLKASPVASGTLTLPATTDTLATQGYVTSQGYITGNQTITLTGDVTGSGIGSFATTIAAGKVTNAMLAGSIAATKLVGSDITIAESQVINLTSDLGLKAPLASPALTGVPTAPTPIGSTNSTQVATTAFVQTAIGGVGGGTVVSVFGRSGAITATTGDYTVTQVTGAAPLTSPSFTGTVTIGTLAGLLKGTTGTVSVATAGTDYLAPSGSGAALTGVVHATGNETVAGNKTWTGKSSLASHVSPTTTDTNPGTGTVTLDCNVSDWHKVVLGGNWTFALANDSIDQHITVLVVQDGTGSRVPTWWSGILWAGGIVPAFTSTPNKIDVFTFKKIGVGSYLGFSPGRNF